MPIATGINGETERFELTSCPGGYVVLKRLTYGEKMFRKSLLGKATIQGGGGGNRADRRAKRNSGFAAELELVNEKVTAYEFANCIVEHNLTYLLNQGDPGSETPLDFKNSVHVKMLDGRVGEEIDELITEYNSFESDEDTGE